MTICVICLAICITILGNNLIDNITDLGINLIDKITSMYLSSINLMSNISGIGLVSNQFSTCFVAGI